MAQSSDPGHFFQTTDSLATSARKAAKSKNKYGDPIKLPSKILAAQVDNAQWPATSVYVAEAAGEVKRVHLETGKIDKLFNQSIAPITCLAVHQSSKTIYAGSWDKTIYAIPLDRPGAVQKLTGHVDFLKSLCIVHLNQTPILLSGGADSTLIAWTIDPTTYTTTLLQKAKLPTKTAIQDIAVDPIPQSTTSSPSLTLHLATSSPQIYTYTLTPITLTANPTHPLSTLSPPAHETSIYRLHFDADGDLWTASADRTAKHLVRERGWVADTVLRHGDFVRDVVVLGEDGEDADGFDDGVKGGAVVVTACRDEGVRVWEAGSGEEVGCLEGHFEEVCGVLKVGGGRVMTFGIDGTVRTWKAGRREVREWVEERRREREEGLDGEEGKGDDGEGLLTAEEEAELAELMDDDDE